jgi:hypothetical protein
LPFWDTDGALLGKTPQQITIILAIQLARASETPYKNNSTDWTIGNGIVRVNLKPRTGINSKAVTDHCKNAKSLK